MVGDVNDCQPSAHPLTERPDGTHAVKITLPVGQCHGLRYPAHDDHRLDEDSADAQDGRDSRLDT
ncbi:hypothetical protein [Kitasatospora aureofaciens]|uniref:hypothetical protein n=1 Tax=Kitasatospora aureofaciens TaxID=1894 RepID=UPI00210EBCDD|nr:hypothetical protein [Kitasatospora aureofaciens]